MRHVASNALLIAALLLVLGGCATRSSTDEAVLLDIAGPIAVEVESFNGDVTIDVDDTLERATVQVERVAKHGYKRTDEAELSLAEIEYSAEVESGPTGPVLRVRTWTNHAEPHFQRAHVKIRLPSAEGVQVQTTRGDVFARNVAGPIDISTTQGEVRLMSNWPLVDPVTITNRDGDIIYRVRGESTGEFDAEAVGGQVDARVLTGRRFTVNLHEPGRLLAMLNTGGNPVQLRTEDGNIKIAVVSDPTNVGFWIVDP